MVQSEEENQQEEVSEETERNEFAHQSQKAYAGERNNQMDQQGIGWLLQLLRNHGQYTDVRQFSVQGASDIVLLAESEESEEELHLEAICGLDGRSPSAYSQSEIQYLYWQDSILTIT